jgi:hypothetical protein
MKNNFGTTGIVICPLGDSKSVYSFIVVIKIQEGNQNRFDATIEVLFNFNIYFSFY